MIMITKKEISELVSSKGHDFAVNQIADSFKDKEVTIDGTKCQSKEDIKECLRRLGFE